MKKAEYKDLVDLIQAQNTMLLSLLQRQQVSVQLPMYKFREAIYTLEGACFMRDKESPCILKHITEYAEGECVLPLNFDTAEECKTFWDHLVNSCFVNYHPENPRDVGGGKSE